MTSLVLRWIIAIAAGVGLSLSCAAVLPTRAAPPGCPARPWALADIVSVPSLWVETAWPPESARRVACFGHSRISFVARGGMLTAIFPGVSVTAAFGQTIYLNSHQVMDNRGWDLNAWVPPDIGMDREDFNALRMTSQGWQNVWWRGSGHFDDPAAARCRPDDGASKVDGRPVTMTPAEAVEFCRNEFVIDRLSWLRVPPTDTLASALLDSPDTRSIVLEGALFLIAFVAILGVPMRWWRRE